MIWNKHSLNKALNKNIEFDLQGDRIKIDSRIIEPQDIFIAFKGENVDGHDYVENALEKGAAFCVVSKIPENLPKQYISKLLLVENTYDTLIKLAQYKRQNSKAKFIAVTGSVGKTSTKEAIFQALSPKSFCSKGNFNNRFGLPIMIASMPDDINYSVFELGISKPGEMQPLSELVKPDLSIITSIAPTHIEFFDSIEGIAEEKSKIFCGMDSNGCAILPRDDRCYEILKKNASEIKNIFSFGKNPSADAILLSYILLGDKATLSFKILGKEVSLTTELLGEHQALNICVALLCAKILGFDLNQAVSNLANLKNPEGRGKTCKVNCFGKNFTIIDDAYNSSPHSLKASLKHIANIQSENKILCLSDMLELGNDSVFYHENICEHVVSVKPKKVIVVGLLMKYLGDKLKQEGVQVIYFQDYLALKNEIHNLVENDDTILFKGSRGTKLHEIVTYIKNHVL